MLTFPFYPLKIFNLFFNALYIDYHIVNRKPKTDSFFNLYRIFRLLSFWVTSIAEMAFSSRLCLRIWKCAIFFLLWFIDEFSCIKLYENEIDEAFFTSWKINLISCVDITFSIVFILQLSTYVCKIENKRNLWKLIYLKDVRNLVLYILYKYALLHTLKWIS